MTLDVSGIRLKIDRAREHLDLIIAQTDIWATENLNFVNQVKLEVTGLWEIYEWGPNSTEPHPIWGVYLGDFAHNARSALDQVIWMLVLANNEKPDRNTSLPICTTLGAWNAEKHHLKGISQKALAVIEGMQPFFSMSQSVNHIH